MRLLIEVNTNEKNEMLEAIGLLNYKLLQINVKHPELKLDTPEPEAEPQAEPQAEPEHSVEKVTITLGELKDIAKEAVTKTDRLTVKNTIAKFAPKLSEVNESDYTALAELLKAL